MPSFGFALLVLGHVVRAAGVLEVLDFMHFLTLSSTAFVNALSPAEVSVASMSDRPIGVLGGALQQQDGALP